MSNLYWLLVFWHFLTYVTHQSSKVISNIHYICFWCCLFSFQEHWPWVYPIWFMSAFGMWRSTGIFQPRLEPMDFLLWGRHANHYFIVVYLHYDTLRNWCVRWAHGQGWGGIVFLFACDVRLFTFIPIVFSNLFWCWPIVTWNNTVMKSQERDAQVCIPLFSQLYVAILWSSSQVFLYHPVID